jgi:L-threonylcarbamoyladenylate synthase
MPSRPQAKILRGTPPNIARLARVLQRGELVAVPTETVYGLAGDALDPRACRKIFQAKGRPTNDPLIVHLADIAQLDLVAERNECVESLAKAFWPGPLTLVLKKKSVVPDLATSGQPSVAVRVPSHPLFRKLLRACGRPLAAPSANPFGYISPTTAEHVRANLGQKIRFILDGGPSQIGLESTILDLRDPKRPAILRPGAIEPKDLARVLKRRIQKPRQPARVAATSAAPAPGMLSKHYSPHTPITLHSRLTARAVRAGTKEDVFLFLFRPKKIPAEAQRRVLWLAEPGDWSGAARALFGTLRKLDTEDWQRIHVEKAHGTNSLALALNDRLTRAAAKR